MRLARSTLTAALLGCVLVPSAHSQETVDLEVIAKIRDEGFNRSQVMDIVGYMTDVLGPRLTGSPNMKDAQAWARSRMEEMGLANTAIEAFGEHGASWDNEYISLHMLEPDYQPLFGYPYAFTPGTEGVVEGEAILLDIREAADMEEHRGRLQGAIVLASPPRPVGPRFEADAVRLSEEDLTEMARSTPASGSPERITVSVAELMQMTEPPAVSQAEVDAFLRAEGVALILRTGQGGDGTIFLGGRPGSRGDRSLVGALSSPPMVAVVPEHYNRMARILQRGVPIRIQAEIRNTLSEADTRAYNVIGEIPGTDLRDEVVMIGGHYDSWHAGTGATDNAAGCAVAMEAMRILQTLGVRPRRTIRIGLWSYEEGGLNGSREYVRAHFGNPRDGKKPEYDRFSVYFNMDNGTGQFRGVYLQGNEYVRSLFAEWMKPFHDLGMSTLTINNTGGTDHLSFDRAGLPGFQFIQDRIDYRSRTHHSNMDVYDKLIPEDLMKNAIIMASFAYHAAMRDEKIPRKPWVE
jgi:hypothetical protein